MTAGRKPRTVVVAAEPLYDQPAIDGATALMRADEGALTLAKAQHDSAVRAVAQQLGYQLPMDHIDTDLIQRDIAANMRRSVEACLEVGRGLRVLKVACEHGQFMARLGVLEIEASVARRFMEAATKFSKRASTHVLTAIGNQTKLFEMLVLDDEQIDELELTGQTGELALDDVATMSVKDLRAALRKERKISARQEEVNKELNAEAIQLKLKGKVVAHTSWPEALVPVADQVAAAGRKLATALSELEACRIAIFTAGEPLGDADRASFEAALGHVADVYQEALARAERAIERERLTFDQTLGAFAEGGAQ